VRRWWRHRALLCPEVSRTLQAYLDRRVDNDWAARVRAHLEHCRRCGTEATLYTELKVALARRERVLRPETLTNLRSFAAHLASHGAAAR
jgi:hypothetical protein